MADSKILAPFILSHEGGYVNDPRDSGGATNRGVTLATYRSVFGNKKTIADLKKITYEEWSIIFKKYYWDKCKADFIENQSVANMLVDFAWHSGVKNAVERIQRAVKVEDDGIMGRVTIGAINSYYLGQDTLFDELKEARLSFMKGCKSWNAHKNGWTKRLDSICFGSLKYSGVTVKC